MDKFCETPGDRKEVTNQVSGVSETILCGKPVDTEGRLHNLRKEIETNGIPQQEESKNEKGEVSNDLQGIGNRIIKILSTITGINYTEGEQKFTETFKGDLYAHLFKEYPTNNIGNELYDLIIAYNHIKYLDGDPPPLDTYLNDDDENGKYTLTINTSKGTIFQIKILKP